MSNIKRTEYSDAVVKFLREKGLNDNAVFALLGNIYAESGVQPKNLQNSYNNKWHITDDEYVVAVDKGNWKSPEGKIFQNDGAGFGICQWTSSGRKLGLYNYVKVRRKSIADIDAQLGWLWEELNSPGYKKVMNTLESGKSIKECSDSIVKNFERPRNQSEDNLQIRAGYGIQFQDLYSKDTESSKPVTSSTGTVNYIMTVDEFVKKIRDIADNYETYYVYGTWGWPATDSNKNRAINARSENKADQKNILSLSPDTFMYDCSGLIKGPLWGWCGDPTRPYGGAGYACNGVPDSSDLMQYCTEVSTDFNNIVSGELLYMPGHVGVCVDGATGLVVECTTKWDHKVLYSYLQEKNPSAARKRHWDKHGKMTQWLDYSNGVTPQPAPQPDPTPQPTPTPSTDVEIINYTVQKGDTLSKIAATYNTTVDAIMKLNPQITDPNKIYVGQVIKVPKNSKDVEPIQSSGPKTIHYTVQRGDTLSKIAKKVNAADSWQTIAKANNIKFPYIIRIGQVLQINVKG